MTRPGGTTPRGLPWPASSTLHTSTPAAIQSLAEAIELMAGSVSPDIVLDTYTGPVNVNTQNGAFTVTFPRLLYCSGFVASPHVSPVGYWTVLGTGGGATGYLHPKLLKDPRPGAIYVCALGWGPPR